MTLFSAFSKTKGVLESISMNSEDGATHFATIFPIVEEKNGLVTTKKGELIPLAKDVISNPSTKEGNDEGMRKIDNESKRSSSLWFPCNLENL